jgi:uncharacterized protein YecE (DUF72 family)
LPGNLVATSTRTKIGIGGWTFAPWRNNFYPKNLPQAQELAFASRQLTSIEINATFYRTQSADTFRRWADATPEDFVFSVKAHRVTTHRKVLAEARESVENFLGSGLLALGQRLGPVLWQFAPTKKFEAEDFAGFLDCLPRRREGRDLRHVVEIRHESFCTEAFIDLLRRHEIAVCYTDSPKFPAIADLCADFVYARLQKADAGHKAGYAPRELDRWAGRIRMWEEGGAPEDLPRIAADGTGRKAARDCFIYMIDGAKEKAPAAALALAERLGIHEPPSE